MALINCKECNKEISSEAEKCPHCGIELNKGLGCGTLIVIGFFGAVLASALLSGQSTTSPTGNTQESAQVDMRQSATGACMLFIKQSLHDPDSAEFGSSKDAVVEQVDETTWKVQRSVRAKNAFNALRLSNFECKMKSEGDTWQPIDVKELK